MHRTWRLACSDGAEVEVPAEVASDATLLESLAECSDGAPGAIAVPFAARAACALADPRSAGEDLRLLAEAIRLARFLGSDRGEERAVLFAGAVASAIGPDRVADLFSSASAAEAKKSAPPPPSDGDSGAPSGCGPSSSPSPSPSSPSRRRRPPPVRPSPCGARTGPPRRS